MPSLPAPMTRWVGRRLLRRVASRGLDLSRLGAVPESFTLPYRRHGLHPVPALAHRRERSAVSHLTRLFGMDVWLVTGYHEVRSVLADRSYSNDIRPLVASAGSSPAHSVGGLGGTDPPQHTRLREVLTPEFTRRRLQRLAPRIDEIVEQQLDVVLAAGPVTDLVQTFAFPIPFLVICELLGLPPDDRERFRRLGADRFDLSAGGVGLFGAASASRGFLLEAVARQRREPGPGLIGAVLRERGTEISDVDLAGLADGVFLGGYETSASMLALGALVLAEDPAARALLVADPAAVDPFIEELLRYLSVVQTAFPRFARTGHELFGQRVRAGDVVLCSLVGANRDPASTVDPDRFDAGRASPGHLAFGHGLHRCVGAELARMELRAAFTGLARRLPGLALAVPAADLRFRELSVVHGIQALPVHPLGPPPAGPPGPVDGP